MSYLINQYSGYGSVISNDEKFIVVANAKEYFSDGDISVVTEYHFTSTKNWRDAGWCRVKEEGQHIAVHSEGDGEKLMKKFQKIA